MPVGNNRERSKLSAGTGLLTLLAFSLVISAGQGLLESAAQAQQIRRPYPGNYSPRLPQATFQGAPIMGSAYQNQASGNAAQSSGAAQNVMIILDDSDSMSENIGSGNENKMVAAKRTVLDVLRNISPDVRVGLRIYGNSTSPFSACHATSVLVPLGQNNRTLIASKMIGIQPTGMTPISYTIMRSLEEDFQMVNGSKTIILISDGIETCGEDPCHVAVRLQQMGINVKINVIGLGLQDYAATKQLRCVALGTKGQFYSANTAAELAQSLGHAMAVETNVQGTIMTPAASGVPMPYPTVAPQAPGIPGPSAASPRPKAHQETYLPAVPIQTKKR
jgi:hypothetical protein